MLQTFVCSFHEGSTQALLTWICFPLKMQEIIAFSPPVHTETMKTIMKMQTFEHTIQSEPQNLPSVVPKITKRKVEVLFGHFSLYG